MGVPYSLHSKLRTTLKFNSLVNSSKVPSLLKIIISHLHAAGTKSELSGIPGIESLRKAIDKFQPDLFIHSHIHELEGVEERIGKTRVINVGKKGKIFEI